MVLLTLVGLYAYFQRGRKEVNDSHSGQDEHEDQSDDVPPVESNDGQTSSQDSSGPPEVLHMAEERITADPRGDDDWIDDTFHVFIRAMSKVNADSFQTPVHVAPDMSVDVSQASDSLAEDKRTIMDISSCRYEMGIALGEGGFGTVYAATRLKDGLQVAVKFASKKDTKYARVGGYSRHIPLEVALQMFANRGPNVPHIIKLLDWQDEADRYVMVLERPMPCQTLDDFLPSYKGTKFEDLVRIIMHQTTFAAQTCCRRGVLHRDIKLENLLINPNTFEVKLIDFGCGAFLNSSGYTSFAGTKEYCPPEYWTNGHYHGEPATVWSLGVLLFLMLCRDFPRRQDLEKIKHKIWTKNGLSRECCDLICCCLQVDPKKRIELKKVGLHNWFKT